jgi:hypothetical protein
MLLDFEVGRCTRRCAATNREIAPGETCYSVLEVQGAEVVRSDFSREGWQGPGTSAMSWWITQVPLPTAKRIKLAPNDVLLELFDELADQPAQQDMRYVLSLLLIRRRVLRVDLASEQINDASIPVNTATSSDSLVVYCPKRNTTYIVPVFVPSPSRIDEIQRQLSQLLIAGAE